jgi:hypothetical protein
MEAETKTTDFFSKVTSTILISCRTRFQTMQNRPHVPTNNSMASSKFSYRLIPHNLKYSSKYFAYFRSLSYIPPTSRNLLRRNFHVECIKFASLLNVTHSFAYMRVEIADFLQHWTYRHRICVVLQQTMAFRPFGCDNSVLEDRCGWFADRIVLFYYTD